MTEMLAVDGSYTRLTDQTARQLVAKGIELWVQCLWTGRETPAGAQHNLSTALGNGLHVACYVSTNGSGSGAWHARQGRRAVSNSVWAKLLFAAADLEIAGTTEAHARELVDELARLAGPRVIYTSYNYWVNEMGNPKSFTDCLLWNALWDEDPDIDFPGLPFGGWSLEQVIGEQYTGGQEIVPGLYVDRDVFVRELVFREPEEDGMKPEELERLKRLENQTKFQQAVLEVFRNRIIFNDELTRRLWTKVFSEDLPQEDGDLGARIDDIQRKLEAIPTDTGAD